MESQAHLTVHCSQHDIRDLFLFTIISSVLFCMNEALNERMGYRYFLNEIVLITFHWLWSILFKTSKKTADILKILSPRQVEILYLSNLDLICDVCS